MVKNFPANAGDVRDTGSISGLRRSSRGVHGNPLQYSCLENPMGRGAWQAAALRVAQSRTWRNNFACMHARMRRRMLCLVFECKFIDHHSSTSSPLITSNVEIKYQKNPILHTGQLNTYSRISQTLLFKIFTCALDRKKEESNFGYIWQMLSNINCLLVTNNDN